MARIGGITSEQLSDEPKSDEAEINKKAELEWNRVKGLIVTHDLNDRAKYRFARVSFIGERIGGWDGKDLEVLVREGKTMIRCQVHNIIDGTRQAEYWQAGWVKVFVRGMVTGIDPMTNTVEIYPIRAGIIAAR